MKVNNSTALLFASIILFCGCNNKNNTSPSTQQSRNQEKSIPFVITDGNNISVKCTLNKIDTVDLMFHTAVNSISIIEDAVDKIGSVNFGDTIDVKSWGGSSESLMSQNNIIEFGDLQFENEDISICKYSGHYTDGKIGYNYFQDKILKIDFDNTQMVILDTLVPVDSSYQKSKIKVENGSMFIEAHVYINDEVHNKWMLIHSGYSKTILFDDKFVADNHLNTKLKVLDESELKDSYGNTLKTKNVIVPKISINGFEFQNQNVGIFEGKISNQTISIVGCEILKKFNMIVDYQNEEIYLQKSIYF